MSREDQLIQTAYATARAKMASEILTWLMTDMIPYVSPSILGMIAKKVAELAAAQ